MFVKEARYKRRGPAPGPDDKMGPMTVLLRPLGCIVDGDAYPSNQPRAASLGGEVMSVSLIFEVLLWFFHLPLAQWSLLFGQGALSK